MRWCGACEVKVDGGADHLFGLQDLLLGAGLISNEDKVFQFRRVYLLELGGDEHTCHAHQLQLVFCHVQLWNLQQAPKDDVSDPTGSDMTRS